jgi:hypothetical protein
MSDDEDTKKATRRAPRHQGASPEPTSPDRAAAQHGGPASDDVTEEVTGVMTTETALEDAHDVQADVVARNRTRFGELVVHYPERDVTIVLDGASASKVMAVHAGVGRRLALQDPLIPMESDMASMWASIDLDRALAMSWMPAIGPLSTRKMTIDPEVPEALQR